MYPRQPASPPPQPLPLSGFPTALEENLSSLRIVKMNGKTKRILDFPPLKCPTCSLPCDNSSALESHIIEKHGSEEENQIWENYKCIPNRINEIVKRALAHQTSKGVLKLRFTDGQQLYLTMPFWCSVTKYFHLQYITIRLFAETLGSSSYWQKFQMKNHLDEMVTVYVDFQQQIHQDQLRQKVKIMKKMYWWQEQGEGIIRQEYPRTSESVRQCISDILKIPNTIEATIQTLTTKKVLYENEKNYYIYIKGENSGMTAVNMAERATTSSTITLDTVEPEKQSENASDSEESDTELTKEQHGNKKKKNKVSKEVFKNSSKAAAESRILKETSVNLRKTRSASKKEKENKTP